MNQANTLMRLSETGVVAVLRAATAEEAVYMAEALIAGGIYGIELTFSTPKVEQAVTVLVERYKECPHVVIGVGTVLDAVSARVAILSGAAFVVSPGFDSETLAMCQLYQVPYIPGCFTMTEIMHATKAGAQLIKLFPGSAVSPDYIKVIKAPLPHVSIMPTGGVNQHNMAEWLSAGAVAVGIGGALSAVSDNDYASLSNLARQYRQTYQEWRETHG